MDDTTLNPRMERFTHEHSRRLLSLYIVYTFVLVAVYDLSASVIHRINQNARVTTFFTVGALLFYGVVFSFMIKQMRLPLRIFGFSMENWKPKLFWTVIYSILFCLFMLLVKYIIITYATQFQTFPLFDFDLKDLDHFAISTQHRISFSLWLISAIFYCIFVPVQAYIIHGAIQSPLLHLLSFKNRGMVSILVTSLVFGALHIDLHIVYALSVIVPAVFWTWLFARQDSLFTVSISHMIIGLWAFWGLGFQHIFFTWSVTVIHLF